MKPLLIVSLAALSLAGCAERESPEEVAAAQADNAAAELAIADQTEEDEERAAAEADDEAAWVRADDEGNRTASFGHPESEAMFSAQCDSTRREIVFARTVDVAGGAVDMKVGTGAQIKVFAADAQSDPVPMVTGRLPASDPVVRAIAASKETVSVQVGDGDTLIVPADETLTQVIENCG